MPVGYYNSSTLIDAIKREAMIPSNQSTFTDADFLALANQETRIGIVPTIMSMHEEYFVRDSDEVPLEDNKSNYTIPYRAIGGKLRSVFYKDTNGNLRAMSRIDPADRSFYQQTNLQNRFIFFFVQGNDIILLPDVGADANGSLIFSYYLRPNDLVDDSRIATISNITEDSGAGTTTFTVDQIPTGFTTTSTHDILQTKPGHQTYNIDVSPTAIDTTNLTLTFDTDDVSSDIIVGDYIAFSGECIIPQIPSALHDVLAQRVAGRCLQALGDQPGLQMAQGRLAEMEIKIGNLVDNRTEGEPVKINNLRGLLRSAKIRKRGWI